jgi:hypothetical protein
MCLFAPHFLYHNNIRVDNEEDLRAFRPVIPPNRGRICLFAPTLVHHNSIRVASNKNNIPPYFDNAREVIIDIKGMPTPKMGAVTEDVGEEQQMKLLDQSGDEKWTQIRKKLGQLKANFQGYSDELEEGLVSAKAEL